MDMPTTSELSAKASLSKSYASEIRNGRVPKRPLAIHIFRATGWRHETIAQLSDEQIAMLEQLEPWQPTAERDA